MNPKKTFPAIPGWNSSANQVYCAQEKKVDSPAKQKAQSEQQRWAGAVAHGATSEE